MGMVGDDNIAHAMSNLRRRSERQDDVEKLRSSFVDVGILQQLSNRDNQILYGRRGTGKTHILKVLAVEASDPFRVMCYVDFRTLGSTAQFSDTTLTIRHRCTTLFRDILAYIHNALMEHILGGEGTLSEQTGNLLEMFAETAISEIRSYHDASVTIKRAISKENNSMGH